MKKCTALLVPAAVLLLIAFGSCSHHNDPGNGCISRYYPATGPLVTSGQLDTIDAFFQKNNLSTARLQFQYINDYNNSAYGTYTGTYYEVAAILLLNGLRAPSTMMSFEFDSTGALIDSIGGYAGQLPNNDTLSHQGLQSLRQHFLDNYKQCILGGGAINSKPVQPTAPYDDTCLIAQYVYLDASVQNPNSIPTGRQLVKAWLVTSADNQYFPEVTVIDNTGQVIPLKFFIP